MIWGLKRVKSARDPRRVLAFLTIWSGPLLAVLGARKVVFVQNHRNICYLVLDKRNKTI